MGLGSVGGGYNLDGCGTMGDEVGGYEEVVVEIESQLGHVWGIRWVVCCLH